MVNPKRNKRLNVINETEDEILEIKKPSIFSFNRFANPIVIKT